jgi:hypothetical protein
LFNFSSNKLENIANAPLERTNYACKELVLLAKVKKEEFKSTTLGVIVITAAAGAIGIILGFVFRLPGLLINTCKDIVDFKKDLKEAWNDAKRNDNQQLYVRIFKNRATAIKGKENYRWATKKLKRVISCSEQIPDGTPYADLKRDLKRVVDEIDNFLR